MDQIQAILFSENRCFSDQGLIKVNIHTYIVHTHKPIKQIHVSHQTLALFPAQLNSVEAVSGSCNGVFEASSSGP